MVRRERAAPEEYAAYIASPAWARRRRRALQRAGHRCQFEVGYDDPLGIPRRCERARYLTVHHLHYDRLGCEADGDLEVLCWFHHMVEHLLQFACARCPDPILPSSTAAARWLMDELRDRGIDLDRGPAAWSVLPTKEALRANLSDPDHCPRCRYELQPRLDWPRA